MKNQQGTSVYVNDQQYQRSANTDGLRTFFGEMRLNRDGEFLESVKYVFQNGSQNRSHFFANVRYKNYSGSYERGMSYMMPFYGVKGRISAITARVSLYTELLVCKEEELAGMGFTDLIFGTEYMRDSEGVAASKDEVIAVMQRDRITVRHMIGERDRELVCKVTSKLWEAQENNPGTRFIIRLNHAEEKSMDLLQSIYMLLPHQLRLQMGFETNVTEQDLKAIQEAKGFPIYVLTAEADETFKTDAFSFPVVIYDLGRCNEYSYDEHKLDILRSVAQEIDDLDAVLLDYSEKKVMESKNEGYSSFTNYEEYVSNMNNVNFWWRSAEITSIEELKAQYDDQKELLNNDALKKEAINEFLVKILPQDKISDQLAEIAVDENYKGRKEYLKFLSEELYQKTQVNALKKTVAAMNQKTDAIIQEKDKQHEEQIGMLKEEFGKEIQAEKDEKNSLKAENRENQEKLAAAEREKEKLAKNNRSLKKKLDELEADPKQENKYRNKIKDLNDRVKTFRMAAIAAAVLLVGTIAFSAVSVVNSSKLKSQIAEKEQLLQVETKKVEDADKKVIELEEKVTALEEEKALLEKEAQQGNTEQVQEGEQNQNVQEGNAAGEQTETPAEEPVPEETPESAEEPVPEETPEPAADTADEQTGELNGGENTTVLQGVYAD